MDANQPSQPNPPDLDSRLLAMRQLQLEMESLYAKLVYLRLMLRLSRH